MLHLPESLMNRLNQTDFLVSLYFRRIHFSDYLFYSLLETPNSWLWQDLRQNGEDRIFERVNIMQENN